MTLIFENPSAANCFSLRKAGKGPIPKRFFLAIGQDIYEVDNGEDKLRRTLIECCYTDRAAEQKVRKLSGFKYQRAKNTVVRHVRYSALGDTVYLSENGKIRPYMIYGDEAEAAFECELLNQ